MKKRQPLQTDAAPGGVAGSRADFLVCGVAMRNGWEIFTTDQDFERYAKCLRITLYRIRS